MALIYIHRILALLAVALSPAWAGEPTDLFEGFRIGWREGWQEQRLALNSTTYAVVDIDGRLALHATSRSANAGLIRKIEVDQPATALLNWAWKVPRCLVHQENERTRAGDDYAARVFVVFETSVIPLRTRAINYIWAAREPAGARYVSPYTSNVGICVVRAGDADAGRWLEESRDVLADYRHFFGEPPKRISAVAVLVDTDNTRTEAEAWFANLRLKASVAAKP